MLRRMGDGRFAKWSSLAQPPVYSLVRLDGDKALRVLEDNRALAAADGAAADAAGGV